MNKLGNTFTISTALMMSLMTGCEAPAPVAESQVQRGETVNAVSAPSPTHAAAKAREDQVNEIYVALLRENNPGLTVAEPESLITIGQGFCMMYDGGAESSDINSYILTAAGLAYTVSELTAMHGAAVGAYCPEHLDKLG